MPAPPPTLGVPPPPKYGGPPYAPPKPPYAPPAPPVPPLPVAPAFDLPPRCVSLLSSSDSPPHALAIVLASVVPNRTSAARLTRGWCISGIRARASTSSGASQNGQPAASKSTW